MLDCRVNYNQKVARIVSWEHVTFCNINLWVPLCEVPYVFVGRPTSPEHVSWLMSDIVLTVFNVALRI